MHSIIETGFFSSIEICLEGFENIKHGIALRAPGYKPNSSKDLARGFTLLFDPVKAIEELEKNIDSDMLKNARYDLKSESWKLWSDDGNEVIGSRGQVVEISLYIPLLQT